MTNPNSTRRTSEQWHSIINDFSTSALSGAAYCKQHQIQYASFCKWRQKILPSTNTQQSSTPSKPFIDISAMSHQHVQESSAWHITLKLGNGVELVLSQA